MMKVQEVKKQSPIQQKVEKRTANVVKKEEKIYNPKDHLTEDQVKGG